MSIKIINGDVSASAKNANSRQSIINEFSKDTDKFNALILGTTACGVGLNIQAANHVIHFSRVWNPAKEEQANDRAYRIGQTKDVHIYYPTMVHPKNEYKTFEEVLAQLLDKKRTITLDLFHASEDSGITEHEISESLA